MIRGKVQADLSGPIGITKQIAKAASRGVVDFSRCIAMLSVYLGLFNLLPLPALDGGRAVFLGIESVHAPAGRTRASRRRCTRRASCCCSACCSSSASRTSSGRASAWRDGAAGAAARAGSAIHDGLVGERALVGTPYLADPELRRRVRPRHRAAHARRRWGRSSREVFAARRACARPRARSGRGDGRGRRGAARALRRRPRGRRASTGSPRRAW